MLHLIPIGSLMVVVNETEHCGIVGEFDNEIGGGRCKAVMCVQRIELGAQHAPLGGPGVNAKGGGGVLVHPLRAIC